MNIVGVVFFSLLVIVLWWAVILMARTIWSPRGMASTSGSILRKFTVEERVAVDVEIDADGQPSDKYETLRRDTVEYRYYLDGREFISSAVFPDGEHTPPVPPAVLAGYYPGCPVTVYYDPRHPEKAFLQRPALGGALWIAALLVFLVALSFTLLPILIYAWGGYAQDILPG